MSGSAAPAVSHGIITGSKPYRMLDEISVANGATRLRALFVLPFLCFLMGALVLAYELAVDSVEDRDVRDMTWDYRVTLAASTAFHAYFRRAYWSTYYAMNDAKEVYREVVIAAEDRPLVLALHGANCHRTVQVPCLATKPEHRAAAAGPLNLGTDEGAWAVGNGRAFKRNATWYGLLDDGLASVPTRYPNATSLAAAQDARAAELAEMRRSAGVPNATANGLSCAADATGQTCGWTAAQWSTWATVAYATLSTATCNTDVDVCAQVSAALRLAAASDAAAGHVAVRVVSGSWTKDNVLLKSLAGTLPVVAVVSNSGNGADALDVQTGVAPNWYPLTDATSADDTAYVPPAAAAAIVSAAAAAAAASNVGYAAPRDADTAYHGLRGGVTVNGVRADLETAFESTRAWKSAKVYDPILQEFWPWAPACGDTAHNVTVASDEVTLTGFPAFNARDDAAATVPVVVLGTTENVPAYASSCDFDGAAAGAAAEAVSCTAAALTVRKKTFPPGILSAFFISYPA